MNWTALGAIIGPCLVFLTWVLSRRERRSSVESEVTIKTVEAAVLSVDVMKGLLLPLETEIESMRGELAEARNQIVSLESHVKLLEKQIYELGGNPLEYPPQGRYR